MAGCDMYAESASQAAERFFAEHPEARNTVPKGDYKPMPDLPVSFLSDYILRWNLAKPPYTAGLLLWLQKRFPVDDIQRSVDLYLIGQRLRGYTEWPLVDMSGNIRDIKFQGHDPKTGHRTDESGGYRVGQFTLHKTLAKGESKAEPCLFGEHLLSLFPDKPVAIVESEKTAFVFSMLMPDRNWLSTGGSNGLGKVKAIAKHLSGKSVTVYPDSGEYSEWLSTLKKYGIKCKVSDICESYPHNVDILDIYMHERFGDPISNQSEDDADTNEVEAANTLISEAIVTTLADHPQRLQQMLASDDTIERCKALLFVGTYHEAMQDVARWEKY